MVPLRKLPARILSRLFPEILRRHAGAAAGILLLAGFVAILLAPFAKAGTATVTVNGILTGGHDYYGTFMPAGTVFAPPETFTLVYTVDDQLGALTTSGGPPPTSSQFASTTTASPADATLTINGNTVRFSTHTANGVPSFYIMQNSNTYDTRADLSWNYGVGYAFGGANGYIDMGWSDPVYTPSYNWESDVSYALNHTSTSSQGVFEFNYSYGTNSTYQAYVNGGTGFITSYVVTGPVTLTPPGTGVAGKNSGCQPCQAGVTNPPLSAGFHMTDITPTAMDGDPINAATGNQTMHETDFVGPAHTQLSFTRYYNSFDQTSGPLGHGWHSTWHRGLSVVGSTATVTATDGRQDTFTLSGSTWVGDTDVTSVLASSGSNYTLTLPNDTVEHYNSSGQLTSIVTRAGLTTTLTYTSGNLTTVTGPFGHTLTFTYDAANRVSTMKPTGGNTYNYYYDGFDNLSQVYYPTGYVRNYAYGDPTYRNLMTGLTDEDGNPYAAWSYDSTGRALTSQLAGGADLTTVTYTSGTSSTVTDANSHTHTYTLTTLNHVVKPTAVSGATDLAAGGAAFTYDANGFIASRTDYDGNVTTYAHNSSGEETSRTEAYGTALARTISTAWNAAWHLPNDVYEPNRTTSFTYDASGNMLTRTVSDGTDTRTWTYTYNGNGQVTSAKDALGNTTTWTYDAHGDVATMVNALNQTTTFSSYDSDGHLLSVTNPLNLTTTYTYDQIGRVLTKKTGGLTTNYYWDQGVHQLSEIKYPDNSYLLFAYDAAHRLTKVTDYAGDYIAYTYDPASNVTAVKVYDPTPTLRLSHSYSYDSANRMVGSTDALSNTTTTSYDSQGNILTVEDPNGHFMTYTYDDLNRRATDENPYSGITTYGYDARDDLTSVKDPLGLTTTYSYNGIGDLLSVVSPDTGTTTNSYNAAGLLLTTTDARGKSASYRYDALNRTTTVSYSGGQVISYLYDTTTNGIGQLGKMIDPAGTTAWTYNSFGLPLTRSQTTGGLTLTTTYGYDGDERLSTIEYPSTKTVTYGYDGSGRVNSISPGASSITYFPFGPASGWTENSGASYVRGFDADGRINATALNSTSTLNAQALTYDPAGRITALSETGTAGNSTYGYDSFDRLTSFFNGTTTGYYTYDADSDRKSSTLSVTTTYNYTAGTNRLASLWNGTTTTSFGYDASGNMTSDGSNTWTYDARGRMATLLAGTTTAAYGINGFGQRISKTGNTVGNGGTNEYLYDEQGNFIGEYGSTGTNIEETEYLPFTPVSVLSHGFGMAGFGPPGSAVPIEVNTGSTGGTAASVSADVRNGAHIITNSSKGFIWTSFPNPFYDNAPNQNPTGLGTYPYNPRGFYYIDAESGIQYANRRDIYYQPLGQFGQFDLLHSLDPGRSGYIYGDQNPLINVDPTGLAPNNIGFDPFRWTCIVTSLCLTFHNNELPQYLPPQTPQYEQPAPETFEPPEQPEFPENPEICIPEQQYGSSFGNEPMPPDSGLPSPITPVPEPSPGTFWPLMRWIGTMGSRFTTPMSPCDLAPGLCGGAGAEGALAIKKRGSN